MPRNSGQGGGGGQGAGGGRGQGGGGGQGVGGGRGQGGGRGAGVGGECVCRSCGTTIPHSPGAPCTSLKCPKCGALMIRR
ncbi:MAG: hypothetical protein P9M15_00700 [Candidatus Electryoneaceae bacterium]|nr:hypothetical protein [Candidatus Electryoneaceae bacterium]